MLRCILNRKISGMYTLHSQKWDLTSPSQQVSVTSMAYTNPVTSVSTPNSSANIKNTPNKNSTAKIPNLCTLPENPSKPAIRILMLFRFLVFHGGSGSSKDEYNKAIGYGVVKVNLDTDLQYAYCAGIRDYMLKKKDYVSSQVGNPDGEDKPNKKYFDPRVWVREGEKSMTKRVKEALDDFKTAGKA